ncbi:MAG: T9SS type A sorting domain-containing protein [Bacteroidales bacterium]|nr:T9SS type A sorting domain-containing protein [Bacteroidales bacterium]
MNLATLTIRSLSTAIASSLRSAGNFKFLLAFLFIFTTFIGYSANRYSVASGNWNSTSTWSTSSNGGAGASVPVAGDVVYIERGKNVTVTVNAACSAINYTTTTATSLTINSGITLTVSGTVTIPRSGSGINLLAVGSGTLNAGSIAFTSGGGTKRHEVTISTGTVNVTGDVTQTSSSGSATFTFTGAGTLNLGGAIFGPSNGDIATAAGCTVAYTGSIAQTIQAYSYVNLTASGSNTKTLAANTSITGILTVNSGSTLALSNFTMGGMTSLVMECGGTSASTISGTAQLTLAGNLTVNDDGAGTSGATISTPLALGANRTFTVADDGTSATDLTISGIISGTNLTILKAGAGTITTTAANSYSGATTISAGMIKLNPAANATPATQYIMNGGDLSTEGITNNRTITSSKTLRLDLSSDIILGSNAHTLTFAASNGETWASNQMLTITGWAGSYNGTAGTAGKIFFGNSASGLTSQQLSKIQFFNGTSYFPAMLLSTGQLVPYALSIATGTISGSPFCEGETAISVPFTYSASSFTGATFTAQLSSAAGSFTSPVTLQNVTSDNSGSQSISVTIPSGTAQGSAYRIRVVSNTPAVTGTDNGSNLTVNALPAAAGSISGSSTVCQSQSSVSYSVGSIANASSYTWAYSGTGATITGSSNSVTISFAANATAGNLTVQGSNTCGTGTVSANFPISVNNLPDAAGSISGSTLVSQGQNNVAYSVGTIANATSYVWGYTGTGATITGSGNSVTISFSGSASSGNVTVMGNNSCGNGASSSFAVTVAGNKTSAADGSWYTASSWSPSGVPGTTDNVTISHNITVDDLPTGICNNLTISNTGSLQIYGGLSLTVNGTLTNNAGIYGLTLNSEASLLNNSSSVDATVVKYIANDNKWHFLSSPVANQDIWPEFAPNPGSGLNFGTTWNWDFYYWNPNSSLTTGLYWVNLRKNTAGDYNDNNVDQAGSYAGFGTTTPAEFTTGRGYLVAYNNNWNPATGSPTDHYFSGSLHSGAVNKAVVIGANNFNLVGNPFASSLDWKASSGWARTDLEANGGGYDYWVYNDNLATGNYGVFNSAGTAGTNGVSRYIAPQQAFFVRAAADGNLGMDFGARAHSSQSFLKTTDAENSFIRLKFSTDANTFSDEMIVEFDPAFNNGGSAKFWSFYTEAPEIFSEKDGNSYSIDRYSNTEEDVVINLGVKTGVEANYTISATNIADFTLSSKVILEDMETGKITDLKKTNSYSFSAGAGDNRNRFRLMIGSTNGVSDNTSSNFNIYTNDNTVYIINEGSSASYKATVSNMIGQVVAEKQINGNTSERIQLGNVPGVYIVTVKSEGKTFSKKVIIH